MILNYRVFFCILPLLLPLSAICQQVSNSIDRDSISVGDEIRYTLTVPRASGVDEVIYPDSTNFGEDFDITAQRSFSGVHADSAVYHLRYFGNEEAAVPEMPVGLISGRDTVWVSVAPTPMTFVSQVNDEDMAFRPFKPLYDFALSLLPFIIGALILAVIVWLSWRHYRNREVEEKPTPEPKEIPPFLNPLLILEENLKSVKNEFPQPKEDIKGYYSNLGNAIRSYFEDLYSIPALESTTSELAVELRQKSVNNTLQSLSLLILQQADMVKFAKFKPNRDQCNEAMKHAENFLAEARRIDGPRVRGMKIKHEEFVREMTEGEEENAEFTN